MMASSEQTIQEAGHDVDARLDVSASKSTKTGIPEKNYKFSRLVLNLQINTFHINL